MDSSRDVDVDSTSTTEVDTGVDEALMFQDIPHDNSDDKSKTHEFTNFPHSALDSDEEPVEDSAKLLNEDKAPSSNSSFWTFAYYQQLFDVDAKQVRKRILGSMLPKPKSYYLAKEIQSNPDLYGPFWICTSLVFTTAIAGNLANYFGSSGKNYQWKYDFHKVTFAAAAIYSYWWFVPLILFGLLWWRGIKYSFTFLEMICIYGYSLAIYIPMSVLWVIQVSWLQWTVVLVGALLSGSVLLMNFWPIICKENKKVAIGILAFIFFMHAALAAGFVLYFFCMPPSSQTSLHPVKNVTFALHPVQETDASVLQTPDKQVGNHVGNKTVNSKEPRFIEEQSVKTENAIKLKTSSSISKESSSQNIEPMTHKQIPIMTNPDKS